MRIIWSSSAKRDLARIIAHIAEDNPIEARRIGQRLLAAPQALSRHPFRGRPGRWQDSREYVLPRLPWFFVYTITSEGISIVRLLHGAQDWPPKG
ncbi:type II toxin-antitoxin system RelE/ParE family toxin [Ferrovibrio sp.]|uniref:type II toxin-antitoxin system RelE/ParE family toxin n=1 Tax=Ferrovibrio sp. TaxID=1917215 RepID=UPI003D0AA231